MEILSHMSAKNAPKTVLTALALNILASILDDFSTKVDRAKVVSAFLVHF
jgi:hypothetical protein